MKYSLLFAMLLLAFVASVSTSGNAEATDKDLVRATLDRYVEAVVTEDLEQYAQVVAHDAEMVNFGAFGDPIVGWEALRVVMEGQNAALDSIQIDQSQVMVHILEPGDNAWATSLWQFHAKAGENMIDLPVRCTWQLQKRGDMWKVVHFHKSIAAQ
jgi:uncharacterized protein (TIGR02246 family)